MTVRRSKHADIYATYGDDVEIEFNVVDKNGDGVDLSSATASYFIAEKGSTTKILTKTESDGIVLSGNTATVSFNTSSLNKAGDFTGQLQIVNDSKAMVAAEGDILIRPLIQ